MCALLAYFTVMSLSVWTDRPGQTVQTKIRLLLIRVYTVCHSVCIVWTHYSMVEPYSSSFRVTTTNFLGVRIFRKFTVSKMSHKTSQKKRKNVSQYSSSYHLVFGFTFAISKNVSDPLDLTHSCLASSKWYLGKQCRPRSDATFCGINSGFPLEYW